MDKIAEFRGKTKQGNWIYGSLVETDCGIKNKPKQWTKTWIVSNSFGNGGWFNIRKKDYVIPETVGQFTRSLDSEGKKIFEGDILENFLGDKCVIEYSQVRLRYVVKFKDCIDDLTEGIIKHETMKIIGNIHDNKEMPF